MPGVWGCPQAFPPALARVRERAGARGWVRVHRAGAEPHHPRPPLNRPRARVADLTSAPVAGILHIPCGGI